MNRFKYCILFTILVLAAGLSYNKTTGQEQQNTLMPQQALHFEHLTVNDGLSQSVVMSILQDSQGFLWFGTQDGLNRYDGENFTIFQPDPDRNNSLSDQWISVLVEDGNGNIWIGTDSGGLNRFDPLTEEFTHFNFDPQNPKSIRSNTIHSLLIDRNSVLWIGTLRGLERFDAETEAFTHFNIDETLWSDVPKSIDRIEPEEELFSPDQPSAESPSVYSIFEDSNGSLWVGTPHGLGILDQTNHTVIQFVNASNKKLDSPVNTIYEDQFGNLWVGTPEGVYRFDSQRQEMTRFFHDSHNYKSLSSDMVFTILEDQNGNLWIGTSDGLNLFDWNTETFSIYKPEPGNPYSLNFSRVFTLYEDREGTLWIGTFGGGVCKLTLARNQFTHFQNNPANPKSLSHNFVFQLFEDQYGYIWIATLGGGLNRFDPQTGDFLVYQQQLGNLSSISSNQVWSVIEDSRGTIWAGTDTGLDALDRSTGEFKRYQFKLDDPLSLGGSPVYSILEDHTGTIWVGYMGGLDRIDPANGKFVHFRPNDDDPNSLHGELVTTIIEGQDGTLWIGTSDGGLNQLNPSSRQVAHYNYAPNSDSDQSLSSDLVVSLLEDRYGMIWIGTDKGLDQLDPKTGQLEHFTEKDGLPNNVINGILEDDDGNIWLSTNNGLSQFNLNSGVFTNFDPFNGLQSKEFNMNAYCKTQDGRLLFGGINGFNIFNPKKLQINTVVPPVVLTSLQAGNRTVEGSRAIDTLESIELQWPNNFFEFQFNVLSYANSDKNKFAYRLNNYDSDWIYSDTPPYGRYTNLPGGTYELQVIGANNDDVWNQEGDTLRVTVIPPFWQTWWFMGGILVFIAGLIGIGLRVRVNTIAAQNRELERLVNERTKEIEALFEQTKELAILEERNRLARELHDSAKQKAFAALAQLGTAQAVFNQKPESSRKHLLEAENLVHEVLQELTFLIQEMHPLALEEKGLPVVLREFVFEWENRCDISVNLKISNERKLPIQTEQSIYRIVQESLANITRHSQAQTANVQLIYTDESAHLTIEDDGRGFDLNKKPNGVGLRSMRERAATVNGTFNIESIIGQGTRIEVSIPIQTGASPTHATEAKETS